MSAPKRYRAVLEAPAGCLLLGGVRRHEYSDSTVIADAETLRDVGMGIETQAGRKVCGFIEMLSRVDGRRAWRKLLHTERQVVSK